MLEDKPSPAAVEQILLHLGLDSKKDELDSRYNNYDACAFFSTVLCVVLSPPTLPSIADMPFHQCKPQIGPSILSADLSKLADATEKAMKEWGAGEYNMEMEISDWLKS